jgi:hypothetical protein
MTEKFTNGGYIKTTFGGLTLALPILATCDITLTEQLSVHSKHNGRNNPSICLNIFSGGTVSERHVY